MSEVETEVQLELMSEGEMDPRADRPFELSAELPNIPEHSELEFGTEQVERRYAPDSDRMVVPVQVDETLASELKNIPDKMAFKIGEVADLLGVKPYVLRYWESEFEFLKPKKSRHNQRMYSRKDVETLLLLKKLLYVDRFSIEGARTAMKKLKKDHTRFKQIRSVKEHVDEAKDILFDLLDDIADFRTMLK